jgi:hypothetical protein
MAKPAGAIEPSDGGYPAINGSPSYAVFAFRLPFQPPHWNNGVTDTRHRLTPLVQITLAAGVNMDDNWALKGDGAPIPISTTTTNGAKAGSWETRNQTQPLVGYSPGFPPLSDSSTLPRYVRGQLRFEKDAAGNGEVMGVHVELTDLDAYADPDPSGERPVEITDRATVRLHEADQPASAWHAQWLVAHTYNKTCYEARQSWSIPL